MKKHIVIILIIFAFSLTMFGIHPARRLSKPGIYERFITKQLGFIGLKVGKIMRRGDVYEITIINFSPKTNFLRLNKPFKSFTLKIRLKRLKPLRRSIISGNKNATRPVIVNERNTKLIIKRKNLAESNFIIGNSAMPKGIIIINT